MSPPAALSREIPFGTAADGTPVTMPLAPASHCHTLVAGGTGQGVTSLLAVIACEAAAAGAAVRICVHETDSDLAASLNGITGITAATGFNAAAALIQDAHAEMYERFETYARGEAGPGWPPIVLIIDDYQEVAAIVSARQRAGESGVPPAVTAIRDIAAYGRAVACTLVLGTHGIALAGLVIHTGLRVGLGPLPRAVRIQLAGTGATRSPRRGPGAGFVTTGDGTWTAFEATKHQPGTDAAASRATGDE